MDNATIKKDIFVAIISNGSMSQKERWKETAIQAYDWVKEMDTVKAPKSRAKKK